MAFRLLSAPEFLSYPHVFRPELFVAGCGRPFSLELFRGVGCPDGLTDKQAVCAKDFEG